MLNAYAVKSQIKPSLLTELMVNVLLKFNVVLCLIRCVSGRVRGRGTACDCKLLRRHVPPPWLSFAGRRSEGHSFFV